MQRSPKKRLAPAPSAGNPPCHPIVPRSPRSFGAVARNGRSKAKDTTRVPRRGLNARWLRPPPWYVGVVALVAAQRLVELRLSRAHELAGGGTRAAPKSYPIMVAAHVGLLTLPLLEVSGRPSVRPRLPWAALLLAASGLRIWSIRSLGPEWNVRAAVPSRLQPVERGPYAYIRHPNYLAVIAEFAALPMVAGARASALALSALNAVLLWHRIRAEEGLLQRSPAYQEIFAQRARFIPRVF